MKAPLDAYEDVEPGVSCYPSAFLAFFFELLESPPSLSSPARRLRYFGVSWTGGVMTFGGTQHSLRQSLAGW